MSKSLPTNIWQWRHYILHIKHIVVYCGMVSSSGLEFYSKVQLRKNLENKTACTRAEYTRPNILKNLKQHWYNVIQWALSVLTPVDLEHSLTLCHHVITTLDPLTLPGWVTSHVIEGRKTANIAVVTMGIVTTGRCLRMVSHRSTLPNNAVWPTHRCYEFLINCQNLEEERFLFERRDMPLFLISFMKTFNIYLRFW